MFASNSWGRAYPMLQVGQIFFSENLRNIAMLLGEWRHDTHVARSSHLPPAKERIMTLKRANVDNKLVFLLTLINLFVWPILNTFQDRFRGFRSYQTNLDSFVALFSSACFSLFYGILATSSSSQMTMRLLYSTSEQWVLFMQV